LFASATSAFLPIALPQSKPSQAIEAKPYVRVARPKYALADGERLQVEFLGLGIPTLLGQDVRETRHRDQDVRMFRLRCNAISALVSLK